MNTFNVSVKSSIRIAVVGCGRIAANHFDAIKAHNKTLQLVGLCEKNGELLVHAEKQQGVPGFEEISELIRVTQPDIVSLCTPSGLHAQQTIDIAKLGVHVITEKPMATRLTDALQMIDACNRANVRLFVVKQIRFNATLLMLKRAIEENRFGRIYLVNINVFWTRPQSYYDEAQWRGTSNLDGGAFMNQASHYIDVLTWLFGPVHYVQAIMGTLGRQIEVEDTGVLNLCWHSGIIGSMNVTMLTYPKNYETSITVIGERGTVKIGGVGANEIHTWQFADSQHDNLKVVPNNAGVFGDKSQGHIYYYENVINTLHGKTVAETDGAEGLKSLEIITAAYISAREKKTVYLPVLKVDNAIYENHST